MVERCLDVETAKELLDDTCDFLEVDDSGVADFWISNREAFLLLIYTSAKLLDTDYDIEFNPFFLLGREPFIVTKNSGYVDSHIPFSASLRRYYDFLFKKKNYKHLFLIDKAKHTWKEYKEEVTESKLDPSDCIALLSRTYRPYKGNTYGCTLKNSRGEAC